MSALEWLVLASVIAAAAWFGWYADKEQQNFRRTGGDMP